MRILDITTADGVPVRVVHRAAGEAGCMNTTGDDAQDVVEFYDARDPGTSAGQSAPTCRAVDLQNASGGLVLERYEPPPLCLDAAAMTRVRAWLAAAVPLTGFQHEHTLLTGISGDLITTDIADVRAGDIIFRGGHLVRRVLRAPARTGERGPDGGHLFAYPVAQLTFPDRPGAGTNEFLTPEGTAVLILRPAPGTGIS
jgi:hypothetical protein